MIIEFLIFFLIIFLSFLSFIGYGKLTNKYILQSEGNEKNQFNFFFIGLIFIIPLSFFYNISIANNNYLNLTFFIFGIFFYIYFFGYKNSKLIFILTFLFFLGLLISKTHEDFSSYHFQHLREISNQYLIFGLANLDERYFYSSIYSYVQILFKFENFDLNLIHIPIYLIYLSLIGYLWTEIKNENKSYLFSIILFLLILKFKRLSEFGYDYIGQFILLYIFSEYIFQKKFTKEKNTKLVLIYLTTILIKVSNLYFFPIILIFLLIQKKLFELLYFKKVLLFFLIFFLVFSLNSFLKTGCFNYLIEKTCLSSKIIKWNFNYEKIENSKKIIKNWSRGLYHQKKDKLNEDEYNKNFNWLSNWLYIYAFNKIGKFILIFFILAFLVRTFIFKNDFNKNFDLGNLLGIILSLSIWLINFPQFRFGFAAIIIFLILILEIFIGDSKVFNKKSFITFCILSLIYFNFSNINRIVKEFKRDDLYKFNNFPWYATPQLNFEYDNSDGFTFVRSSKNENFWTTCFNAPVICANHKEKIKFKIKGRNLFIYDYD